MSSNSNRVRLAELPQSMRSSSVQTPPETPFVNAKRGRSMHDSREPQPAEPGDVQPLPAVRKAANVTARRRARPRRWRHIAVFAALSAVVTWAIGREAARRIERHSIEVSSRQHPPAAGFQMQSRTVANNEMVTRMGWVADLEGMAIAYAEEDEAAQGAGHLPHNRPSPLALRQGLAAQRARGSGGPHENQRKLTAP